ncbi:hypothetical protein CER18_03770 [Bartonella tribocorum]|uniref:Uncharacterized protein n=1 Tax=Bartonella tribocorum TaxID=85701 RepID=A0A2M6USZ9_9HYPH|nr:hypothetical protein CER18_03770 [Bartonella tribocorum]
MDRFINLFKRADIKDNALNQKIKMLFMQSLKYQNSTVILEAGKFYDGVSLALICLNICFKHAAALRLDVDI